jgi:CRISPR/Cas system CMR subunit Cmr6 (Cas7 group RAMP superfamily)
MNCQFLPKLSIRLLAIFTHIIHKYPTFWEKFQEFYWKLKAKAAVYFNQYEYVYVLLKVKTATALTIQRQE